MSRHVRRAFGLIVLATLVTCPGCGGGLGDAPPTVPVEGTVSMDGSPLADATVTFTAENPADRLRTVSGVTDASGHYQLEFSLSQSGAQPGKYVVSITTQREADEDENGDPMPAVRERVPQDYNLRSQLTAEVSSSQSKFDFELDSSKGDVIQATEDNE